MRVFSLALSGFRNLALPGLAALLLAGCSNAGLDRLSSDGSGESSSSSYTATVAPLDDSVVAQPIPVSTGTGSFQARPVQSADTGSDLPAAIPVEEPVPTEVAAVDPAPAIAGTSGGLTHKVKPGETMYSLARSYQVKPAAIAEANGLPRDAMLKVGQTVTIPGGAVASASGGAPTQIDLTPVVDAPKQVASRTPAEETVTDESPDAAAIDTQPAAPVDASAPTFRWPVQGRVISGFGTKPNGLKNEGINISVPEGTPVRAAESGVVAYAGNELKGYGNLILIRHDGGFVTAYAHNKELSVKRGDAVKRGDVIAKAGRTGSVESPQLHFEVRKGPTALDPMKYLGSAAASGE